MPSAMYRAAYVVSDEKIAMLLVDPMRRTILNLLADGEYTQSQMAEIVGLTNASVGHHIRILSEANLIKVVRREEEIHGIMQNFYRSVALCIVVDIERMSKSVSKYFFPINIERLRGAVAALTSENVVDTRTKMNTKRSEEIAENLAISIARQARRLGNQKTRLDRESITIEIYRRALKETIPSLERALVSAK
ncbi:MAG TPA: ArsR family transcriptional regulator [Nitrososphaerales archaeon]|nr:ArsR family transcriptional regulator [Nitrososphaerales archaeon]